MTIEQPVRVIYYFNSFLIIYFFIRIYRIYNYMIYAIVIFEIFIFLDAVL